MSRPVANLRLFVSIEPPRAVAERLVSAVAAANIEGLRLGRPDQVHLTVHFIGDTPSRELERVAESVRAAASGVPPFTFGISGLIVLPEVGPARLIAARAEAPPELIELHRRLAHRLARRTRRDATDDFLPHFTLARFIFPRALSGGVRAAITGAPVTLEPFAVTSVRLMRSTLHAGGAEHHEVATANLRYR